MNTADAARRGLDLMRMAETAILTTVDPDDFPETRAMFNLRRTEQFPDLAPLFAEGGNAFTTYFTTNTSSTKVAHIKRNPKVSVYYCDPREFRGLMLSGRVEIVTDPVVKQKVWQKGWEIYYPAGADDPDNTVLRLRPALAKYYHQLDRCTIPLEVGQ